MSKRQTPSQLIAEAEAAVASITDPELKRFAFEKALGLSGAAPPSLFDSISRLIQVVSVVAGVIISVLSITATWQSEANAREAEAAARELELKRFMAERQDSELAQRSASAQPFLKLRQDYYLEAVKVAAVLASPESHTPEELKTAKTRFRDLYVTELSLIEGFGVEKAMVDLAQEVDPELAELTPKQSAAYNLSHALRDSLVKSWNLQEEIVDNKH